jgi:molybdate transport system substrate-binding protein
MLVAGCHAPRPATLTLSVAASLTNAMAEIEAAYSREHRDVGFRNNAGSSGTLSMEIQQGAPVDIFLSAASKPMDNLAAKGLLLADTRRDLLRNELVLIAPANSSLESFDGLADSSIKIVAIGDPASVPAGEYGEQTLATLHLMDKLRSRLVLGKDVRQVLTYVETGNADAGLVYATDARTSGRVRVVAAAPDSTHDPIVYPVAVLRESKSPEAAREFVRFLEGDEAKAVFLKYGFTMVSR